jgi:hypothetical protein
MSSKDIRVGQLSEIIESSGFLRLSLVAQARFQSEYTQKMQNQPPESAFQEVHRKIQAAKDSLLVKPRKLGPILAEKMPN